MSAAPRGPAQRWFRPHLAVYLIACLAGITAAFSGAVGNAFAVFAGLSLWGMGLALHGYVAIVGTGRDRAE